MAERGSATRRLGISVRCQLRASARSWRSKRRSGEPLRAGQPGARRRHDRRRVAHARRRPRNKLRAGQQLGARLEGACGAPAGGAAAGARQRDLLPPCAQARPRRRSRRRWWRRGGRARPNRQRCSGRRPARADAPGQILRDEAEAEAVGGDGGSEGGSEGGSDGANAEEHRDTLVRDAISRLRQAAFVDARAGGARHHDRGRQPQRGCMRQIADVRDGRAAAGSQPCRRLRLCCAKRFT